MGITGLLPFLQDASRKCYINEFRGCTVAIDSYCWLHKGAFACAEKIVRGEETNVYINYCMKYIELLVSYNIKPIMVFDGQHLPAKKDTEAKRREQRNFARARGVELLRLGKLEEARQYFRQCVDITHKLALGLIKECRKRSIDCIVAPYEADAQLAFLNLEGIADIIITEDSDLVLFGCKKILFKFALDGSGILIEQERLNLAMKMRPDEYSFEKFRYMCIMSGCDYLDSLSGIGLKRAHKAITMTSDPDIYKLLQRLPRYLNLKNLVVSQEYMENFRLADATIRHQIVYNPVTRKLQPLTDPASCGTDEKHLKNAGSFYEEDRAFQLALGNIDPISKKVMDNWNPDEATPSITSSSTSSSIWSRNYKKSSSLQKNTNGSSIKVNSTKLKKLALSSDEIAAIREQQMSDYDRQLSEELKMYKSEKQVPKRPKLDSATSNSSENNVTLEKLKSEAETKSINPFAINKKRNKISKFNSTNLDSNVRVQSRFFNTSSTREVCDSESDCDKSGYASDAITLEDDTEKCNRTKPAQTATSKNSIVELTDSKVDATGDYNNIKSERFCISKRKIYKKSQDSDNTLSNATSPVLKQNASQGCKSASEKPNCVSQKSNDGEYWTDSSSMGDSNPNVLSSNSSSPIYNSTSPVFSLSSQPKRDTSRVHTIFEITNAQLEADIETHTTKEVTAVEQVGAASYYEDKKEIELINICDSDETGDRNSLEKDAIDDKYTTNKNAPINSLDQVLQRELLKENVQPSCSTIKLPPKHKKKKVFQPTISALFNKLRSLK